MFSDKVAGELGSSRKETTVNSFAESRFGGEASYGMKEGCQGRKRELMIDAVGLMKLQLRLERKLLAGR